MTHNKNKDSKTLEEEIKIWQEVYPIEEGMVVDLNTETSYEGNNVLLNDDSMKESNTRKAKPFNYHSSKLDITDVQTTAQFNQNETVNNQNTVEEKKGIGTRFMELMGIFDVEHEGEKITVYTREDEKYTFDYQNYLNEEIIEGEMREVKEHSDNSVRDRVKLLRDQFKEDIKLKNKPK